MQIKNLIESLSIVICTFSLLNGMREENNKSGGNLSLSEIVKQYEDIELEIVETKNHILSSDANHMLNFNETTTLLAAYSEKIKQENRPLTKSSITAKYLNCTLRYLMPVLDQAALILWLRNYTDWNKANNLFLLEHDVLLEQCVDNLEGVKICVQAGAKMDGDTFKRGLGFSPLLKAITAQQVEIVRYLLSLGASTTYTNYMGKNASNQAEFALQTFHENITNLPKEVIAEKIENMRKIMHLLTHS